MPITDAEIRAIEKLAAGPAQRLAVALAAEHAARTNIIRHLTLDDLDLPNRRITLDGHNQRLGELSYRALRVWLDHRRATWPRTPNRHVLVNTKTVLDTGPVSGPHVRFCLGRNGFSIDRIRADRILHEALAAAPIRCTSHWSSPSPMPRPPATRPWPNICSATNSSNRLTSESARHR